MTVQESAGLRVRPLVVMVETLLMSALSAAAFFFVFTRSSFYCPRLPDNNHESLKKLLSERYGN